MVGNNEHSAVKICRWTKESLRKNRVCYKQLWYSPVQSHRCMQMTPYIGCNYHCLYCWRLHSGDRRGHTWKEFPLNLREFDEPKAIVEQAIEKRRRLLIGFKGNMVINREKFDEALKPTMMTMSLTGEPTLYGPISELIEEAKKVNMITFLVTNGSNPEVLEKMNPLPYQLYVSISAPNKITYNKIARPSIKDSWKNLENTLDLLPSLATRKVIRLTMIKGLNMINPLEYVRLINKAKPNFIEVKAYEWVGESQRRLPKNAMPFMDDVRNFAKKISEISNYQIKDEFQPSGVVLLS